MKKNQNFEGDLYVHDNTIVSLIWGGVDTAHASPSCVHACD